MENHGKSNIHGVLCFFFESNINMGHLGHFALSDYWRVSGWNVRESIGLREIYRKPSSGKVYPIQGGNLWQNMV